MKKLLLLSLALFGILLLTNPANAQDQRAKQLDSLFHTAHRLGVFNGNVLITEKGKVLYKASFGFTDASKKIRLDDTYRFNIGSIAKEFNAVAIMMLKEKGKLQLDDRVSKYLKDLPKWADSISILNLLQYTSGLPNSKWNEIRSDSVNLAFLKTVQRLDFKPGSKYVYNNNNTFLQRQVVERISGMSFKQFVKEKMLTPLGMKNSIVDPTSNDEKIAIAYNNLGVEDSLIPPISGWTNVTIDDFHKWANAISNYRLINPASTKAILYGYAPGNQAGLGKGMMEGRTLVAHTHDGTTRNYQALLVTTAVNDRVVLLLTNNQQNNLYAFNSSIAAILDRMPYALVKKSFLSAYKERIAQMNAVQFLDFYAEKQRTSAQEFGFDSDRSLNEIGYQYLNAGKTADALAIFKKNTTLFPKSGNAWDSLAEATLATGDAANALIYYQKAYEADPLNAAAKKMVEQLSQKNR